MLPVTTRCRPEDGSCDLGEFCDGKAEFCPSDAHKMDGTECESNKGVSQSVTTLEDSVCVLIQARKLMSLSTGPTTHKSHNLLRNPINCIEGVGNFTGPLKISTGPT